MGCDIHCFAEKLNKDINNYELVSDIYTEYEYPDIFNERNYVIFAFLANVRNYYNIIPINYPEEVIPRDSCDFIKARYFEWGSDAHSASCIDLDTLLNFNYDKPLEFLDSSKSTNFIEIITVPANIKTYRELLEPEGYFEELEIFKGHEIDRIIFWFDN